MSKFSFVTSMIGKHLRRQATNCPHCGSKNTVMLQRKKVLLQLRRCQECALMYRYPKDQLENSIEFYQENYQEGLTTELPSSTDLLELVTKGFTGTSLDISRHITLIQKEVQVGTILDFGCSWGYGISQFNQAGYGALGFEVSKPRAEYGRQHLAVEILDDQASLSRLDSKSFDIIYTSHVLEHLSELHETFTSFRRLIKPTGLLFIFVPNAGGKLAREYGVDWGPMIGEKHTLALDAKFFNKSLRQYGFLPRFNSSPYCTPHIDYKFDEQIYAALPGDELLVIASYSN